MSKKNLAYFQTVKTYLSVRPFVLDNSANFLDYFITHEELLGSGRYIARE
jgi:hypothetical protein